MTDTVLMIRPARFGSNAQTAGSNAFQQVSRLDADSSQARAVAEFAALRAALERAGVRVVVFDDTEEPHTPDAVFPNNWVSFHDDGTIVLYPMQAENRRLERRTDILEALATERGFEVTRVVDLSEYEDRGQFLEGTGSLVLDRANRIAFACLSPRTHREPLADFASQLGYETVVFEAFASGAPIYHTNVMMWVGRTVAAVCAAAIPQSDERERVLERLAANGRDVVLLAEHQLLEFAGNMLELEADGGRVLVMSERARRSLRADQIGTLGRHGEVVSVDISHIEDVGGGGARCMIAAIHLPARSYR